MSHNIHCEHCVLGLRCPGQGAREATAPPAKKKNGATREIWSNFF